MDIDAGRLHDDAPGTLRTVLFSDVVRSTEIIDEIGDAAWLDVVDLHTRTVVAAAREHRGTIASFQGDGFMIMFDRPDDALACARRLQRDAASNQSLGLRIGIDHGYVYAFRTYWWVGLTLHIAARLTDLCEHGGIALSDRSARALSTPLPTDVETQLMAIRGLCDPCIVHMIGPSGGGSCAPPQPSARPMANSAP